MRHSVGLDAMKRNREPRNASIPSAIRWGNGIPRISALNCGNIFNSRLNKGESIRVFPAFQLDGARCVALHPHGEHSHRPALFR